MLACQVTAPVTDEIDTFCRSTDQPRWLENPKKPPECGSASSPQARGEGDEAEPHKEKSMSTTKTEKTIDDTAREPKVTEAPTHLEQLLLESGAARLTSRVLLAILLGDSDTEAAELLLTNSGGLARLPMLYHDQGILTHDVPAGPRARLLAHLELSRRTLYRKTQGSGFLSQPGQLALYVYLAHAHESRASAGVLYLDSEQNLTTELIFRRGHDETSAFDSRGIFRKAIEFDAESIVYFNCRPSRTCDPKPQDLDLALQLSKAGMALGIPLKDYLIVGYPEGWVSFEVSDMLPEPG
jgi:DNA repair protein RadC